MRTSSANLTNTAPFTLALIALSVLYYIVMMQAAARSGMPTSGMGGLNLDILIQFGASYREGVWDNGWQRFVLPLIMHGNLLHIVFNMYSLYRFGPAAEVHFGSQNFFSIYVLSGVLGVCLSLIFGDYGNVSVGASGALFGLMGSWLAVKLSKCHDFKRALKNSEVRDVALYIVMNYAICFMLPSIDHWAHLGGLLAGIGYGFMFEVWRKHHRISIVFLVLALSVTAGGIVGSRWMVWNPHYHIHLGLLAEKAGRAEEAQAHFKEALERGKTWKANSAYFELQRAAENAARQNDYERIAVYENLKDGVVSKKFQRYALVIPE